MCAVSWFLGPGSWVLPVVLLLVLALALALVLVLVQVLALVPSSGLGGPNVCPGPGLVLAMAPVLVLVGWSWGDGWFSYAFPMGMVLNYHTGLTISRTLRIWPALAKLLCRFVKQHDEPTCYTKIQLKKSYAAHMHVDGNDQGGEVGG